MAGYQPRHDTDPVWFNGTKINHLDITSTQVGVFITAVHGWDERPDVRDVREQRPGQDGEYADNLYLGGRTIVIEGEVYGSTWANLQSRKRTLAAIFTPSSDEALLKIPDPSTASPTTVYAATGMTGYERVSARVIESITFGDTLDPCCQTFQVALRASDPRVYSDVETSTDSGTSGTAARTVTVDQGGTYPTPVTLTVTGPTGSSFAVSNSADSSGLSLPITGITLAAGESATFDTIDRTVVMSAPITQLRTRHPSIVAHWPFNETSGSTADNAQGTSAYDGTYTNSPTLNQTGHAAGIASVQLDGTNDYITTPYAAALWPTNMTFEAWVYVTDTGQGTVVDTLGTIGGFRVATISDGSYFYMILSGGAGATYKVQSGKSAWFPLSTWRHVVVVKEDTQWRFYVDGNDYTAPLTVGTSAPATATPPFVFGRSNSTTDNYLACRISHASVFNTAMAASEVVDLYESSVAATGTLPAYQYLDAELSRWAHLDASSTTLALASDGLNTGSKLNVSYRDARL